MLENRQKGRIIQWLGELSRVEASEWVDLSSGWRERDAGRLLRGWIYPVGGGNGPLGGPQEDENIQRLAEIGAEERYRIRQQTAARAVMR